ncbi:MAG: hypothetical protein GY820_10575, partial [Gammaproteobacteria bacterium]|nr:hypothetical protein [Gammaproteobacteria bacterium]
MKSMRKAMRRLHQLEKNRQIAEGIYRRKVQAKVIKLEDGQEEIVKPEVIVIDEPDTEEKGAHPEEKGQPDDGSSSESSSSGSSSDSSDEEEEGEGEGEDGEESEGEGEEGDSDGEHPLKIDEEVEEKGEEEVDGGDKDETAPGEEKMDQTEPPKQPYQKVQKGKFPTVEEAEEDLRRWKESGQSAEDHDAYDAYTISIDKAREREEDERHLAELQQQRKKEGLGDMSENEAIIAVRHSRALERSRLQKESIAEYKANLAASASISAANWKTAPGQIAFKQPLPPTQEKSPFYLATKKTGVGGRPRLEGRQLQAGELWKPVGFFQNISKGTSFQNEVTNRGFYGKPMAEFSETRRIEKLWGRVADPRDWELRTIVRDALASIKEKRGSHRLPFLGTYHREIQRTTVEAMAPGPAQMRMVGPLNAIGEIEENYRSPPGGWLPGTGMELPIIGDKENPLFSLHIQERFSFLSLKSQMNPPADFRAKYDLEWKNDKLYATERDLVVHIMDQYDKPVPLRGDVDAMKLTNMFSLMFGTGLADSINSVVVDRSN